MLRFLICFMALGFSGAALAAPPVVLEFFGQNTCQADSDLQQEISDLTKKYENLIVVNCRQWYQDSKGREANLKHSHKFCNDRSISYKDRLHDRALVIVNGRWSANFAQMEPALKLGRLDGLVSADVSVDHDLDVLNIDLPALDKTVNGRIYVYAYAPTESDFQYLVDVNTKLTDDLRQKMREGQSVPFVTRANKSQYMFRPVLGHAYAGEWDGQKAHIEYDLSELLAFESQVKPSDISYVVLVQENDEIGPMLASGETISFAEQSTSFPSSKPNPIRHVSESDKL